MYPKKDTYHLRKVVTRQDTAPDGSSGYAYLFKKNPLTISDGQHIGRFWPAEYDEAQDCFIVTGNGRQMKNGEVVQEFHVQTGIDFAQGDNLLTWRNIIADTFKIDYQEAMLIAIDCIKRV